MGKICASQIKKYKDENNTQLVNEAFFDSQFKYHTVIVKARAHQAPMGSHEAIGSERI